MKKILLFPICIIILLLNVAEVSADFSEMFENKQDYLVLGTVKDVNETSVIVSVDNVISGGERLRNTDITIKRFAYSYCDKHTSFDFNKPKIGDNIFASLDSDGEQYRVCVGCLKVNSSEIKNCSIVAYSDQNGEDCLGELVQVAYFIRSDGKMNNFKSKDNKIYAVSDDDEVLIYPLDDDNSIVFVDKDGNLVSGKIKDDVIPTSPNVDNKHSKTDNRWIISISIVVSGLVLTIIIFYFAYVRKRL